MSLMDQLRNQIFDYLYPLNEPRTIERIAVELNETPQTIQTAVDHPWFTRTDEQVAIAYKE